MRDSVTGRLVAPQDPEALAHGLVWALRNRAMLAEACRASARPWTLDAYATRLHDALLDDDAAPRPVVPGAGTRTPHGAAG